MSDDVTLITAFFYRLQVPPILLRYYVPHVCITSRYRLTHYKYSSTLIIPSTININPSLIPSVQTSFHGSVCPDISQFVHHLLELETNTTMPFRSTLIKHLVFKETSYRATNNSSSRGSRTIVRDPRKNKKTPASLIPSEEGQNAIPQKKSQLLYPFKSPLDSPTTSSSINSSMDIRRSTASPPFAPSQENQQSIGSTFVSYALAGAGMTLGFVLVGAVLGGF